MAALQNKRFNLFAMLTLLAALCLTVLCGCASTAIAVGEGSFSAGELAPDLEDNESNVRQREEYLGQLGRFEGLSAENELQILWDYVEYYHELYEMPYGYEFLVNDTFVSAYYGTYNGWIVVRIWLHGSIDFTGGGRRSIGGIEFSSYLYLSVWKDGILHNIQDAYCRHGVLTVEDLQNIKNILDNERGGSR